MTNLTVEQLKIAISVLQSILDTLNNTDHQELTKQYKEAHVVRVPYGPFLFNPVQKNKLAGFKQTYY